MKRSVPAATVALLLLLGATALAHTPLTPAHDPTPTPTVQNGALPQGAGSQNADGDMNDENDGPDMTEGPDAADKQDGKSDTNEVGDVEDQSGDSQSGDMQTGDSQSGAQQDGEFEGEN